MQNNFSNSFFLNLNWHHLWCKCPPNNFFRGYVKGPFTNNCIVCSFPLLSFSQKNNKETQLSPLRKGIPDSFAEYIFYNSMSSSHNEMRKEDLDIVDTLRKNYRLYLGQGIPDPSVTHTCRCNPLNNLDTKGEINYHLSSLMHEKNQRSLNGNQRCNCCEKKYLFDCPDKTEDYSSNTKSYKTLKCTCPICHTENLAQPFEKFFCTPNFKSINKDDDQRKGKNKKKIRDVKNIKNSSIDLKSAHTSDTQQEILTQSNRTQKCTCSQTKRLIFTSPGKNVEYLYNSKTYQPDSYSCSDNQKGDPCMRDSEMKICMCPYFKDTMIDFKVKEKISVETQTENQLLKLSQSIQTEKYGKCKCKENCFLCKILKQNDQILKSINKKEQRNPSRIPFVQKFPEISSYSNSDQRFIESFHNPSHSKISQNKKLAIDAENQTVLIPSNQFIKENKFLTKKSKSTFHNKGFDLNYHKDLLKSNKKIPNREVLPLAFYCSKYLTDDFVQSHLPWDDIVKKKDLPHHPGNFRISKKSNSDITLEKPLWKKSFEKNELNKVNKPLGKKISQYSELDYFLDIYNEINSFSKMKDAGVPFINYNTGFKNKLATTNANLRVNEAISNVKKAASYESRMLSLTKFKNENVQIKKKVLCEAKKQRFGTKKKCTLPKFFKSAVKVSKQLKKKKENL